MNPAAWACIGLAVIIIAYVTGFDVWAHFANAQSISGRIHEWLHGEITGPLIVGLSSGALFGLVFHLITTGNH